MKETNLLNNAPFNASDYLDNDETITGYLSVALRNPDPNAFLNAGLGRESLYKALKPGAKPRFDTILRLLGALDVKLEIVSSHSQA